MSMEQERDLIACENVGKTFQTPTGDHEVVRSFHFPQRKTSSSPCLAPDSAEKVRSSICWPVWSL